VRFLLTMKSTLPSSSSRSGKNSWKLGASSEIVEKRSPVGVISAVRMSGETLNPVAEELKVVCTKTVRVVQVKRECYDDAVA
jgi:hypothetical protein